MRITFVTGVHWESLLRGDDPLQDLAGAAFTFEQLMETALIDERFDLSQVPDRFLAEELGGELKPSFGRKLRSLVEKAAGSPKTDTLEP